MVRIVSAICQLVVFGGMGTMAKYHYSYKAMRNDLQHNERAVNAFSSDPRREIYDVVVVGGGIVGVATARELLKTFPRMRVALLEKEADVALHQSGHNSGVIHAGMYYPPGSMMSRLCPRGHELMISYCQKHKLPMELVGKLIVASKESDIPAVEKLYEQGVANGVKGLEMLRSQEEIHKLEPNVRGLVALHSPNTGVVDFANVTRHMLKELMLSKPANFRAEFCFEAQSFSTLRVVANNSTLPGNVDSLVMVRGRETGQIGPEKVVIARHAITCCGLSNDLIAKETGTVLWNSGAQRVSQTIGIRGRYYQLKPHARGLVKRNVYPAPDLRRGISVGIHFTPTVDERRGSQMIIGPGSTFATARYGYTPFNVDADYLYNILTSYSGWKCLQRGVKTLLETMYTDLSRGSFLKAAQKLVPAVGEADVEESFCGVMGLAVGADGKLEHDLSLELARPPAHQSIRINRDNSLTRTGAMSGELDGLKEVPLVLNVRNAPSPAATSSMAIAEEIVATAIEKFGLH